MADIQHANIPDTNLHQCKGAATASAGQFLRAVGDGTATFQNYTQTTSDFQILDGITSFSTAEQTLTAVNTELQIAYGAAATSPGGDISIAVDGTVTFNTPGVYHLSGFVTASRTTNASVASLAFSARRNGVQAGQTEVVNIDGSADVLATLTGSGLVQANAGDTVSYHMLLTADPGGTVGIYPTTISQSGWASSPSASITVVRLGNTEV